VRRLAARGYFALCLTAGRLLRAATYSSVQVSASNRGEPVVRKRRRFYAPLLIAANDLLARILDPGVRVLSQREWEDRERQINARLRGTSIGVDADGLLVLPFLKGRTLAALLEDQGVNHSVRTRAIERAAVALAELHRLAFTHGDAMAENVIVDLDAGVANWFDFETRHEDDRPLVWRRADDLRALLATCLVRTADAKRGETLGVVLNAYGDEDVTRALARRFSSVWRRSLTYDLVQAPLSYECFCDIGRLLRERRDRGEALDGFDSP
jgi:tRNA A-37 threonylcarbamoyl transferase component Bud32